MKKTALSLAVLSLLVSAPVLAQTKAETAALDAATATASAVVTLSNLYTVANAAEKARVSYAVLKASDNSAIADEVLTRIQAEEIDKALAVYKKTLAK